MSKDRRTPEAVAQGWLQRAARKEAQAAKTQDTGYRGMLLREATRLRIKAQRLANGVTQ